MFKSPTTSSQGKVPGTGTVTITTPAANALLVDEVNFVAR
jgi:hypothetical protein